MDPAPDAPDRPPFLYDAFISYRHCEPDRRWAKWLHAALETYRVPRPLVARGFPARLSRVFRDEEELPANADLSTQIRTALDQSRFLIVICSPRSPQSRWVNAEIEHFRALGRHDRILALLIEGDPRQSFPPALTAIRRAVVDASGGSREEIEEVEPLAADVRADRTDEKAHVLRGYARLRLMACILGCRFDDLRQRDAERRARRSRLILAGLGALTISMGAVAGVAIFQWDRAQRGESEATEQARSARFAADEARRQAALARASEARAEARRAEAEQARAEEAAQRVRATHRATLATAASLAERHPGVAAAVLAELPDDAADSRRAIEVSYQTLAFTPSHIRYPLGDNSSDLLITPDGSRVVAVTFGGLHVLDPAARRPPMVLDAPDDVLKIGALSPDGRLVAAAGTLGGVHVWSLDSGELLHSFRNHGGDGLDAEVTTLRFTADSAGILSGSLDRTLRLYRFDHDSHIVLRFERPVLDAHLAPDGRTLVVLAGERSPDWSVQSHHALRRRGTPFLLRSGDDRPLWTLGGSYTRSPLADEADPAVWIGLDADAAPIVAHASGLTRRHDPARTATPIDLHRSPGAPAFVSLSHDRRHLLQDRLGGEVAVVPIERPRSTDTLCWGRHQTHDQLHAAFLGDPDAVLTQSIGLLQVWQRPRDRSHVAGITEPWIPICTLSPLMRMITDAAAAPAARVVAAISMDEVLEIWSLPLTGELTDASGRSATTDWKGDTLLSRVLDIQPRYPTDRQPLRALRFRAAEPNFMRLFLQSDAPGRAFVHATANPLRGNGYAGRNKGFLTPDGHALATGWSAGGASWNTRTGAIAAVPGPTGRRDIEDLDFHAPSALAAIASMSGSALARITPGIAPAWTPLPDASPTLAVALAPDARRLVDLTSDRRLRLWGVDDRALLARIEAPPLGAGALLAFLHEPQPRILAADNRHVSLYHVTPSALRPAWSADRRADIETLRTHPHLPLAALGYEDGGLLLIDARGPEVRTREWRGPAEIEAIEIAPDASRVAAVVEGGAILVVETDTDAEPMLLAAGVMDAAAHATFSADSRRLHVVGMGGGLCSLALDWPARRRELQATIGPGLSPLERHRHLGEPAPAPPAARPAPDTPDPDPR